jgi:hypothetical protein
VGGLVYWIARRIGPEDASLDFDDDVSQTIENWNVTSFVRKEQTGIFANELPRRIYGPYCEKV